MKRNMQIAMTSNRIPPTTLPRMAARGDRVEPDEVGVLGMGMVEGMEGIDMMCSGAPAKLA